jgi:hypothetical protein
MSGVTIEVYVLARSSLAESPISLGFSNLTRLPLQSPALSPAPPPPPPHHPLALPGQFFENMFLGRSSYCAVRTRTREDLAAYWGQDRERRSKERHRICQFDWACRSFLVCGCALFRLGRSWIRYWALMCSIYLFLPYRPRATYHPSTKRSKIPRPTFPFKSANIG